jgi:hypothetical protein
MRHGGNTMQHFTTPVTLVGFEGSNGQPPQKGTSVCFGGHTQSGRTEAPANVWAEALSPPPKLEYVPGSTVRAQRYSALNLSYRLLTRPTPILDKMRVNFDTAVACPFPPRNRFSAFPVFYIGPSLHSDLRITDHCAQNVGVPSCPCRHGLAPGPQIVALTRKVPCGGPASNFRKVGGDIGILC